MNNTTTTKNIGVSNKELEELSNKLTQENLSKHLEASQFMPILELAATAKKLEQVHTLTLLYCNYLNENCYLYIPQDAASSRILLLENKEKNTVCVLEEAQAISKLGRQILTYCKNLPLSIYDYTQMFNTAICGMRDDRILSEMPPSITLDPSELSFHKFILPTDDAPTPGFDSIVNRLKCSKKQLHAFLYAAISGKPLQQYLYINGFGDDGKSTLMNALLKVMKGAAASTSFAADSRWVMTGVGRKLLVFSDIQNSDNLKSEQFMKMTGRDGNTVDPKYRDAISIKLDCLAILTSNAEPAISSEKQYSRRIIYAEIEEATEATFFPNLRAALDSEMPYILKKGKAIFEELYNESKEQLKQCEIASDILKVSTHTHSAKFNMILSKYFNIDKGNKELKITGNDITEILTKNERLTNYELRDFFKHLRNAERIQKQQLFLPDKSRPYGYVGIEIKPEFKSELSSEKIKLIERK